MPSALPWVIMGMLCAGWCSRVCRRLAFGDDGNQHSAVDGGEVNFSIHALYMTADGLRIGYNGTVARILKPELPFDHASN